MGTLIDENTTTQCEKILRHMREVGPITQLIAAKSFGCFRLAARIADLEGRGYAIRHELVFDKNEDGHTIHYARYSLIKEQMA